MTNQVKLTALDAVIEILDATQGLRCYLTGSAVAAAHAQEKFGTHATDYQDLDLFVGSEATWIQVIQYLLDHGFTHHDRSEMLWKRVLHYGTKGWHTNSMKLHSPQGSETNIIYKKVNNNPTTSLSAVLESFDFGLLSMGWETETGVFRDARPYQFPGLNPEGPLPLLPWRREQLRLGHFREHQGLRTFGRVVKYFHDYAWDGSLVLPDLIEGYAAAGEYFMDRIEPEKQRLGEIYQAVSDFLLAREWEELRQASAALPSSNDLDIIYEILVEP